MVDHLLLPRILPRHNPSLSVVHADEITSRIQPVEAFLS